MKFKSKSLISVILSIMMVISMIIVAIPANAAVINSVPVGADTYYLWYQDGKDNPAYYTKKLELKSIGDNLYEETAKITTSEYHYAIVNQNAETAEDNSIWTNNSQPTVTYDSSLEPKKNYIQSGAWGKYGALKFSIKNEYIPINLKFTFNSETKAIHVSEASTTPTVPTTEPTTEPTQPTTQPTTTPTPTTQYYIGGRFKTSTTDTFTGAGYEWNADSENVPFVETETTGIYKVETGLTVADLSGQTSGKQDYFFLITAKSGTTTSYYGDSNKSGTYHNFQKYISSSSSASLGIVSGDDAKRLIKFNDPSATTGLVTIFLDTNGGMKLWYTTDGTSTTDGAYKISDKTEGHGKLSISAAGKTPGTADANNEVTITVTPESYFSCTSLTVTGADKTAIKTTGSGNSYTFIMPSQDVTVKATFTLDKTAYIASLGDGLWIDVDPDHSDTSSTLIKWNNYSGSNHGTSNPYTFYVPKNVDLTNAKVYNGFDSEVKLNDVSIPANSCNTDTLNIPAGSTYSTSGATTESVKVMQGSTDAMFLYTTKSGSAYSLPTQTNQGAIGDKITKEAVKTDGGVCKTMSNTTSTASYSGVMNLESVKGRGNSSWEASHKEFGKYAFNMKLATKTNLLGMDSAESKGAKSWCLLANNADESMLRNALTYQLASEIGLLYSPEFRFVDIYDNGEYMGSYLVTEKVDVGSSKLVKGISYEDINEDYAKKSGLTEVDETTSKGTYNNNSTDNMQYAKVTVDGVTTNVPCDNTVADAKLKGKYLLEFEIGERYESEASWFTSPKGQHVVVKNPEFATKEQVTFIAQKFAAMEDKVFKNASKSELSTVMDVESFAKMYLIQEFSSNLDAASTSYYLTFDCSQANPVFVANPVWDYDWAYGQYTNTNNIGAKKPVSGNGQDEYLQTSDPKKWVAKYKSMDDSKGGSAYSIQSQLASKNSAFKTEIRKQWEGLNGFYTTIQKYYGTDGQIMTWYNQIKDSVDMNETRWGFIESDPISGWGSTETGDTHADAVNYLNNTWTAARATWLNTQFTSDEYPAYTPSAPTIKAYAADGTTEISAVDAGSPFIIKVTSDLESGVVYRLYKDGVKVGTDRSDGNFDIATDESMVGSKCTYTVTAVYGGRESLASTGVEITINEKAGNKTVRVYFKTATAPAYAPSVSFDGGDATAMTTKALELGKDYSGALTFAWYSVEIQNVDTTKTHTLTFTSKRTKLNATWNGTLTKDSYFTADNLMRDTVAVNLTDEHPIKRNFFYSATNMVYDSTDAKNKTLGFTFVGGSRVKMGTVVNESNGTVTPVSAPTVKSATYIQMVNASMITVSSLQSELYDVNFDGKVDIKDATYIQYALAS